MLICDISHRLTVDEVIVGSAQRRSMPNAQLVLPVADFCVILLYADSLRFESFYHIVNHILGEGHPYAGVVQAFVTWNEAVAFLSCEVPLRFHSDLKG